MPLLQANRAHTYLGLREKEYHVSGDLTDIYPDFVMMANAFGVKAKRVSKPEELRPAIQVCLAPHAYWCMREMVKFFACFILEEAGHI